MNLPSYEESQSTNDAKGDEDGKSSRPKSISIRDQLIRSRLTHISTLTKTTILPAILTNFTPNSTIQKVTLILIPSDALQFIHINQDFKSNSSSGHGNREKASLEDNKHVTMTVKNIVLPLLSPGSTGVILQLREEENKTAFWHQGGVLREMTRSVVDGLSSKNHSWKDIDGDMISFRHSLWDEQLVQQYLPIQANKNDTTLFTSSKTSKKKSKKSNPTGSTGSWNLGWRSTPIELDSDRNHEALQAPSISEAITENAYEDGIKVTTQHQNVVFRFETGLGLWDSRTVGCIWMNVEIRI